MSGDIRLRREFIATAVLLVLLALLPLVTRDVYWLGVLLVSAYFAILASSWNLLAGFTGQFSLAPAAFAMIGAYGAALSSAYYNVPPVIGLIIGTGAAGLVGLVLGRIVMRLRGPYLALTTLSFAEIARLVASNSINITRGDLGLPIEPWFNDRVIWFYVFLGALAFVICGLYLLLRSKAGLFLEAIRDDEIAAARSGVRIVFWKTAAFAGPGVELAPAEVQPGRVVLKIGLAPESARHKLRLAYQVNEADREHPAWRDRAQATADVELHPDTPTIVQVRQDRGRMEFSGRRMKNVETFRIDLSAAP